MKGALHCESEYNRGAGCGKTARPDLYGGLYVNEVPTISTVAEYVESPEIIRLLKICGVDKIQGNYISVPLPALPNSNVVELHKKTFEGK